MQLKAPVAVISTAGAASKELLVNSNNALYARLQILLVLSRK